MTWADFRRRTLASLLAVVAGCGYDPTATGHPDPPAPSPNDGLWTASGTVPAILRLSQSQLRTGGALPAATTLTTPSAHLFQVNSVAFDADGTMWIASQDDSLLLAFAPAALSPSGVRAASVVIASGGGSLSAPTALAFDRQHRLWVANFANGTLARFDRAQLATSGTPVPAVVLTGVGRPRGMAFDDAGSLWVSDGRATTLSRYSAAQLETSGAPAPDVVLRSADRSLGNPTGLAFDAAGSLWVANLGVQSVVAFDRSQLAASGAPAPRVVLSPTEPGASLPVGLAFDADGSLWVVSGDARILRYDRTVLGASGAPRPSVDLTVEGHSLLWSAAFWPRPAGLPLN